jgi:hypothetical protein
VSQTWSMVYADHVKPEKEGKMIVRRNKQTEIDLFKTAGEVNRFGVKILPSGEQWILDGKTGKPAKRDGYNCVKGESGAYVWIKEGDSLRALDTTFPSIWENNLHNKGDN